MSVSVCLCVCVQAGNAGQLCESVHIHMYVYMHVCVCVHLHLSIYVLCIHAYIYACIHACTHTRIHICNDNVAGRQRWTSLRERARYMYIDILYVCIYYISRPATLDNSTRACTGKFSRCRIIVWCIPPTITRAMLAPR